MLDLVKAFCETENLLSDNDRILIAVSGGVDSMVLLNVLCQLQETFHLQLHVAHLNHQLRPDSEADATFVVDQAKQKGLAYTLKTLDVASLANENKQSVETAGRHARYQFLNQVSRAEGLEKIALAHHKNDQAETFFLNIIRGANAQGWGGMKAMSDCYIRPLLCVSKSEILQYAKDQNIPFQEDKTNADEQFRRNWVRHRVIPLLEEKNKNFVDSITRNQVIFRQMADYLRQQAEFELRQLLVSKSNHEISIRRQAFIDHHPALQAELIRLVINNLLGDLNRIESQHILNICDQAKRPTSGQILELPFGLRVNIQPEKLLFTFQIEEFPVLEKQELNIPGEIKWSNWAIKTTLEQANHPQNMGRLSVCMDWSKIETPLVVRSRQPGDRIDPMGLSGHKKIQDIFVDAKVNRTARNQVPLIEDQQGIIWVVGHCQSERTRVTTASKQVLTIRAEQNETGN